MIYQPSNSDKTPPGRSTVSVHVRDAVDEFFIGAAERIDHALSSPGVDYATLCIRRHLLVE